MPVTSLVDCCIDCSSSSFIFIYFLFLRLTHNVMTRQQRRHTPPDPAPLIYTSLSTRRSSYPTWMLIKSSPTPHIVRRSDLGNEATELLFSMNRAVQVPPLVNDVAESLDWLAHSAPLPLAYCRRTIIVCLEEVCDFNSRSYIHPLNAHFSIMMVALSTVLDNFFPGISYR
jgi:hypothetical protein